MDLYQVHGIPSLEGTGHRRIPFEPTVWYGGSKTLWRKNAWFSGQKSQENGTDSENLRR